MKSKVQAIDLEGCDLTVLEVLADKPAALSDVPSIHADVIGMNLTQTMRALSRLVGRGLAFEGRYSLGDPSSYAITAAGLSVVKEMGVLREFPDDRPSIGGHPLPWSIVPYVPPPAKRPEPGEDGVASPTEHVDITDDCEESPQAYIVDADGYRVLDRFSIESGAGKLWGAVVEHLAKPRETMADLTLAEKAAKVAKIRLENERREGNSEALAANHKAVVAAARTLVERCFHSITMSKKRSISVECFDGDRGVIVHGADLHELVQALEASS